jgi:hypothetical protein
MKAPALSRPLDPAVTSNRFVVVATAVIGAVVGMATLIRGESLSEAASWGFVAAGSGFIGWAVARELQPDHVWVATVATFVAPLGLFWGRSDLLASATVLLVARTVAGTTGRSLRAADLILLAAVGGPLVVRDSGPGALAMGAVGLAVSVVWHEHRRSNHLAAAALYATGAIAALPLTDTLGLPAGDEWLVLWIGLGAGLVGLIGPVHPTSIEDRSGGEVLAGRRVWAARLVALGTAVAVSLSFDPSAVAPVWAALAAVALRPR